LSLLEKSIEAHTKHAQRALQRLQKQRDAGQKSGRSRASKALAKPAEVLLEYQKRIDAGHEVRYIAGKLATKFDVTSDHIRAILRKHRIKPKRS
jgi:transposase